MSRTLRRVWPCLLAAGLTWVAPARSLELELQRYPVEGGEVQFRTDPPMELPALPIDRQGENVQSAAVPGFTLYADLDEIEYIDRGGYFRYKLYVEPRAQPGPVVVFTAKGRPVGRFLPQMGEVGFTLRGPTNEQGSIPLPLFSEERGFVSSPDWEKPGKPIDIEIPGTKPIFIALKNRLGLPVQVVSIRQPSSGDLWSSALLRQPGEKEFRPFQIGASDEQKELLVLDMRPGPRALAEAIFAAVRGGEHDRLQASLVCSTPWENLPQQTLSIVVPVRFVPYLPTLIIPVALGTLLGSLIPQLLGGRRRSRWWKAYSVALLVALVVEVVAMLLVRFGNSQFRLLGLELDPFQFLPAALIGFVMGMLGFKSIDILRRYFPDWRTRGSSPKARTT